MRLTSYVAAAFAALLIIAQPVTAPADDKALENYVQGLADKTLQIIEDGSLSKSAKQQKLEDMFTNTVDVKWIAKFVLGRHWRTLDKTQQEAYIEAYRQFISRHYASRFTDYVGQRLSILGSREEEKGEFLVNTELVNPSNPSQNVVIDYRVRKEGSAFKIYDIVVEGVSLITTQRSEFGSVVQRKGLEYLIDQLNAKAKANTIMDS